MKLKTSKVLVFFLSFVTVVVIIFSALYLSVVSTALISGMSVLDSFVSQPFQRFVQTTEELRSLSSIYQENADLKSSLYRQMRNQNELESLQEQNEELKSLLELKSSFSSSKVVAAKVINRNTAAWQDSLQVDSGKDENISDHFLVVANGGLIGLVSDVSASSSRVSLLTNSSIGEVVTIKITAKSGEYFGVLSGYDDTNAAFIIRQLNRSGTLEEGDLVSTSGLGDYPVANIPVGTVLKTVENSDGNLEREVLVKPAADFRSISFVMLVGS